MARYALAEHVFVCLNGEHLVLLDLKEDRYWALEASKTAGLGGLVGGWPVRAPDGAAGVGIESPEAGAVLEAFRGRGILAQAGAAAGKDATPVVPTPAATELIAGDEPAGARAGGVAAFLAACVFAKLALRTWRLERVILRVRHRKVTQRARQGALDVRRARSLVEAFIRYRVYLFSSKDECLYDSLALIEFLARHGIYPDWRFGVQTRPFAAHCWVQQDDVVFNDTVEHVSSFTPIMVV